MWFPAMAIQPGRTHGVDVGRELTRELEENDWQHKQAWMTCGFRDGAQWSRAIHGEAHAPLDFWKLMELPTDLLASFFGRCLSMKLKMAKAAIAEQSERKAG
jgi:hypothetical protein